MEMILDRRGFLGRSAATMAALALAGCGGKQAADGAIKLGCLMDATGPLSLEGKPMVLATKLAVDEINAGGGLLGRKIELISYDTQSNMQLYTQYAQRLALDDAVDVVHGALTSASREAIRPILSRAGVPLFYNTLYEGGVCDRNIFCTGTTPTQTIAHLIDHAAKHWGKKAYVLAADYNFGQISAGWIKHFLQAAGGDVVQADYFPLDATNFSSTIGRIQQARPDFVFTVLVGGAQTGFYRQWSAAGLKDSIPIASNVFGLSDEINSMDVATTDGIMTCYGWYPGLDTPASQRFDDRMTSTFGKELTGMSELDAATYEGVMLWASGVRKAGSLDRDKLLAALESGIHFDGPSGPVEIDPKTHHVVRTTYLGTPENGKWKILQSFPQQRPTDDGGRCDLPARPTTNTQFTPTA